MMNPVAFPNGPFLILLAILTGTAAGTLAQDDAPAEPPEKQSTDPPSDRAIAERVQGVIAAQNSSGFDHVDVAVENQIVTLSGRVGSLAVRERAVDLARHVLGAGAVVDQILVQPPDVDDDELRRSVEEALAADSVVEEIPISVTAARGEVGLAGTVTSLAEKEIAGRVAANVRGVGRVINQLVVRPTSRGDDELKPEIERLIDNSVPLQAAEIKVAVADGVVTLSGSVAAEWQVPLLEKRASVPGVTAVETGDVRVRNQPLPILQPTDTPADAAIAETIKLAMRSDPLLLSYADQIDVAVEKGLVTLRGTVARPRAQRTAARIAKHTVGVRTINNQIKVKWTGAEISDDQILDDAIAAIERSPYLQSHELRVHCRRGHLQLYGVVDNEFEKQVATWTLDGQQGVLHVANMLAVAPQWQPREDAEIAAELNKKLKTALLADSVQATVENGVAVLRGQVDSWGQWQAALDLSLEAGARKPHNLIRVKGHPAHHGRDTFVP